VPAIEKRGFFAGVRLGPGGVVGRDAQGPATWLRGVIVSLSGCYSARDLVFQGEQIARLAIQAVGLQMRVCLGIDQLDADTNPVARPPDAPSGT
jgi:hypothetical protein